MHRGYDCEIDYSYPSKEHYKNDIFSSQSNYNKIVFNHTYFVKIDDVMDWKMPFATRRYKM